MAHELTVRKDGKVEMAFTGPREAIWHGLGQNLENGASLDEWKTAAGMDFEVLESAVSYNALGHDVFFPDRKALFRSDTLEPLSIVGPEFKIVQPGEVIEFFRDLVQLHGMELSTAGTLFGGRRFWALAEMGKEFEVTKGDFVKQHLLLTTAVDGSMATTGKVVATRVVCNNTLRVALSGSSQNAVRVTHKKMFDPTAVKINLGLIDESWAKTMANLKKLANVKMNPRETQLFFEEQLFDKDKTVDEQTWGVVRQVRKLTELAQNGSGSDMSRGTAWGALCAATELYTHGSGRRDLSHQFWESYHGSLDAKKYSTYQSLVYA